MRKFVTMFGVLVGAAVIIAGRVFAGSASQSFQVTASVIADCTIGTTAISFGDYDPLSANPISATGTISVTCTQNAPSVTIALDNGANAANKPNISGVTRAMKNGTSFLGYDILQPDNSSEWATGASALPVTPTGALQNFTANGHVPAQQNAAFGSYSDTVTATVNF